MHLEEETQTKTSSFEAFADTWDEMYSEENAGRSAEYRKRADIAFEEVNERIAKGGRVLDIGCGAGQFALRLAGSGYDVTAVDFEPGMIEHARRRFADAGLEGTMFSGEIADVPLGDKFDAICALGVSEYVPDLDMFLQGIYDRLKVGGFAVISFTNSATIFNRIELPLKQALAAGMYLRTRSAVHRRLSKSPGKPYARTEIFPRFRRAGFSVVNERFFGYGFRFGNTWMPGYPKNEELGAFCESKGFDNLGRTFFVVAQKQPSTTEVRDLYLSDLSAVSDVHEKAFAGSMGVGLGRAYIQRFLRWFVERDGTISLVQADDNGPLGYVFGAFLGTLSEMNLQVGPVAAMQIAKKPGLLLQKPFRRELLRRAKLLIGSTEKTDTPSLLEPVMSLVGIGTAPTAQGQGVGTRLVEAFIARAQEQGAATIRLSVYRSNTKAIALYEKFGFKQMAHPTNPDVVYCALDLQTMNTSETTS